MATPLVQQWLHRLEVGGGSRYVRFALGLLALLALFLASNLLLFRNFSTQEAMDSAQLARNLAEGKGYTTLFVRPLSLSLIKQTNEKKPQQSAGLAPDYPRIKGMHPDISNPPLYPALLAGWMKVMPVSYEAVSTPHPLWAKNGQFWRYGPDFCIGLFNQVLFLSAVALVFFLARRLFDPAVAWLSAVILLGTELLWRFSMSGLPTMLLLLIFVGLAWCLVLLEKSDEPNGMTWRRTLLLGAAAGVLVGLGALTRYSFGWLILPLAVYFGLFGGARRTPLVLVTTCAFLIVLAPWVARNFSVSGTPFGTATYAPLEATPLFPGHSLERSMDPPLENPMPILGVLRHKLTGNARQIVENELPRLGGSWVTALCAVGLLVGFQNSSARRLRYFLVSCLVMLIVAQALGRTQLSEDSPDVNSENLLVLLAPLVIVYGVSLFFLLLDQVRFPFPEMRRVTIGVFGVLMCLPMLLSFLPPYASPVNFPPYHPVAIQRAAGLLAPDELMMSDVPWATAWYGQRQSVWTTPHALKDFYAINDFRKPVGCLFLTSKTLEGPVFSDEWTQFALACMANRPPPEKLPTPPANFPLSKIIGGLLPSHLVLTDPIHLRRVELQLRENASKPESSAPTQ